MNEVVVIVHVEERLGRVDDSPDDHGRDLDRVAGEVVDLEPLALEVPHPQRDAPLGEERVDPPQARLAHRAHVVAEELEDLRLVRADREQADQAEEAGDSTKHPQDDEQRTAHSRSGQEHQAAHDQSSQEQGQHPQPRLGNDQYLAHDL